MIFQEDFEQMRSLEQDLTFLSAKTEFDESNIPFKEKNSHYIMKANFQNGDIIQKRSKEYGCNF